MSPWRCWALAQRTREQIDAASLRAHAVLVSAAAGSGKTTVLTDRVAGLCLDGADPCDINQLLVVTFTEKAALEMRARIGRRFKDRAEEGDERARAQLLVLGDAQISTIHAFGYALVREEWERAGRDPDLQLLDERAATLLRLRSLDAAMDAGYQSLDGMAELVARFGGMGEDAALREAILDASAFLDALPDSESALRRMVQAAGDEGAFKETLWRLREDSARTLRLAASLLRQAAEAARRGSDQSLSLGLQAEAERILEQATSGGESWEEHRLRVAGLASFPALSGIGKCLPAQRLRESAKRKVRDLASWLGASPQELLWQRQRETLPWLSLFATLIEGFRETYRREKIRLRALDFSDLEQEAYALLRAPDREVAARLRRRYREVLVDEYQDVNPLQNAIVDEIAGAEGRSDLFTVGDPKQSIYAFRHAAPGIFLEREKRCLAQGAALPLRENFRCRPEVVAVVNHVFRQLMPEPNSPRYDALAELVAGRPAESIAPGPQDVQLVLIGGGVDPAGEGVQELRDGEGEPLEAEEEILGSAEQEATWIAREIKRLVAEGCLVYDRAEERTRPLAFRDCAVLLRGLSTVAASFQDAFEAAGVPAEVQRSTGYRSSLEVQTVVGLLRALELPERDRDLAIALRAPFFGLSAVQLRALREAGGKESLWEGLRRLAADNAALQAAYQRLLAWRRASLAQPLGEFVPWLLRETGYRSYVAGMPRSTRRLRDLDDLAWRAVRFSSGGRGGLGLFLREFEELGRRAVDEAPPQAGIADAVSVLTIHRSKGLEWPVVFVAGLHRAMRFSQGSPVLRWHLVHGLGPAWVDLRQGVRRETAALRFIRAESKLEALREEVRLLYVALTRARDRLYLTAVTAEQAPVPGMDEDRLLGARRQLDWLWPALQEADGLPVRILRAAAPLGEPRSAQTLAGLAGGIAPTAPDEAALAFLRSLPQGMDDAATAPVARLSATDVADAAEGAFGAALRRRHHRPAGRPELGGGGRAGGTLTHLFLQHLDYRRSAEHLEAQLEALIARGILPAQARAAIDRAALGRFLQTPLARRLQEPSLLQREVAFSLLLDDEGRPDPAGGILLQGKIDLLLHDAEGWLVLDFKTDHVSEEGAGEAAKAYEGQVDVYRAAVRAITGAKEVRAALVFLRPGVVVPL